eukprot:350390-Chlamydomonas_euryale.AAC.4
MANPTAQRNLAQSRCFFVREEATEHVISDMAVTFSMAITLGMVSICGVTFCPTSFVEVLHGPTDDDRLPVCRSRFRHSDPLYHMHVEQGGKVKRPNIFLGRDEGDVCCQSTNENHDGVIATHILQPSGKGKGCNSPAGSNDQGGVSTSFMNLQPVYHAAKELHLLFHKGVNNELKASSIFIKAG